MKEKITASLLITTEDKILIQDNGNKRMKLPGVVKKVNIQLNRLLSNLRVS